MPLMKIFCIILLFGSVAVLSSAEKQHEWQHGKVISQNVNSTAVGVWTAPVGTAVASVPLYRRSSNVIIETDQARYEAIEVGPRALLLPVNSDIDFYRHGNLLVIKDPTDSKSKKKHKFELVGITIKKSQIQ